MGQHDGDIIFKTPDKEFLRFKGDGTILVEGRPVECDEQVVATFKKCFLIENAGTQGARGGDVTFHSGKGLSKEAPGGDVVVTNYGFYNRWVYFDRHGVPQASPSTEKSL